MARYSHVVVGMGASGFSVARYLMGQGHAVAATDSRVAPPMLARLEKDMPVSTGGIDAALLSSAECIVLSPGVSRADPRIAAEIARGKPVVGDIELFAMATDVPVIAITGTNAKSTVTTLVGEMAKGAGLAVGVGGNLGTPALDLLSPANELYVLELSSFQLESVFSLAPKVASILNVTPDHLDRYPDFEAYVQAKQRIYQRTSFAVCNADDALTQCQKKEVSLLNFTLGSAGEGHVGLSRQGDDTFLAVGTIPVMPVSELPLKGRHAIANSLAALAIGTACGLPLPAMVQTLRTFRGLPHRCQLVRERAGVRWYDDSKGTNVGATLAAINGFGVDYPKKLILIAGGVGKGADFSSLLPAIQQYVKEIILIGESAPELQRLFQAVIPVHLAGSMEEAVREAEELAAPGEIVLLSPACASFDMFNNFEHRGSVFAACVNGLT